MTNNLDFNNKLSELANEAYEFAKQKNFNFDTIHNGDVDAFRHLYSSAMLTIEYGKFADAFFGDLYELANKNPSKEKIMDFYNNQVGQEIGEKLSKNIKSLKFNNNDELKTYIAYEVEQAIKNKKAITSLSDKRIIKTLENMPDHPLRIYTREEIDKMTTSDFSKNEKNIFKQLKNYGIPRYIEAEEKVKSGDFIYVNSYIRDDGTEVSGYYRRK